MSHDEDDEEFDTLSFYRRWDVPSQILPWMYLGDAQHSSRRKTIDSLNIRYIVNCAGDCDNHFITDRNMKYLHIRVSDCVTSRLNEHFDTAFEFIESARQDYEKAIAAGEPAPPTILIHCMAGISRSATIVISYIMRTERIPLMAALRKVKSKRGIISPNHGFLAQLSVLELNLGLSGGIELLASWEVNVESLCTRSKSFAASGRQHLSLGYHYKLQLEEQEAALNMIVVQDEEVERKKQALLSKLKEARDQLAALDSQAN
jgi:protein-tyrosine phosphatase